MSVAELERAATAPRRWIALSSSEKRNKDGVLPNRMARPLKNLQGRRYHELYLVPGGRYLVACDLVYLSVWDLGFVSDKDPFLQTTQVWVTARKNISGFLVNPTPDGMGIRILAYSYVDNLIYDIFQYLTPRRYDDTMYVFDIYPQREIILIHPECKSCGAYSRLSWRKSIHVLFIWK
jgi:hypothetical protein